MKNIYFKLFCFILLLPGSGYLLAQTTEPVSQLIPYVTDSLLLKIKAVKSAKDVEQLANFLASRKNFLYNQVKEHYDWATEINHLNTALVLANKIGFTKLMAPIIVELKWAKGYSIYREGVNASLNRNFDLSLKNYFKVIKISEDIKDTACIINQYFTIGMAYYQIRNFSEALRYLLLSLKMSLEQEKEDLARHESLYLQLGLTYQRLGNYPEALKYCFKSIEIKNQIVPLRSDTLRYRVLGAIYKDMGNYPEALRYFFATLKKYSASKVSQSRLSTEIGTVYYKQAYSLNGIDAKEKYDEAINYLHKGLAIALEIKDDPSFYFHDASWYILDAYFGLYNAYKGIDDSKNSLLYLTSYLDMKDSMFNNELSTKVSEINTQHEVEKAQIEAKARQQLIVANEKATSEKILADQKLEQEKKFADERIINEKAIAKEIFEKEKAIEAERANSEKSMAAEKVKREKLRAEKQQMNNLLLMGLILVVMSSVFLFFFLRQRNEKKIAVEKAESIHKMAELEMQSLRSQLNPHFMFNSLNSIQTLILKEDSDKSQSYLSQFARLLRMLLENADKPFIPLEKEINFLALYLSLESLRVPDMQYSISADSELDKEKTFIPNMFLQPYVENAIWHGLSHKENNKRLQIRIFRQNGTVNYEIEDNGVGRKKAEELKSLFRKQHQSKGMELLSKRIKLLNKEYSSSIQIDVTDVMTGNEVTGTLVSVKVPVKPSVHLQN
ncbi:MAG TPA: histidine kinase [Chitinophagaceae bacterium]